MIIKQSIDIEDEIRKALSPYMTAYCRPLPAKYKLPNILVTQVGGTDDGGNIDTFDITLDARAKSAAAANETMRSAIAILREVARKQETAIRYLEVNTTGAWGNDPLRPDLSMYSARIRVVAHTEQRTI